MYPTKSVFTILGICISFCFDFFCPCPDARDPFGFPGRACKKRHRRLDAFSPTSPQREWRNSRQPGRQNREKNGKKVARMMLIVETQIIITVIITTITLLTISMKITVAKKNSQTALTEIRHTCTQLLTK